MKTPRLVSILFLFLSLGMLGSISAETLARQILGVRLSMSEEEAHTRLREIGSMVREESLSQEVWKVRDPNYANILIGYAKDGKLRYVTAVARTDKEGERVAYSAIGDLKKAKQAGDSKIKVYNYQWHLPAEKAEPETMVFAIGRDPEHLDTYSLKRLGEGAKAEDND